MSLKSEKVNHELNPVDFLKFMLAITYSTGVALGVIKIIDFSKIDISKPIQQKGLELIKDDNTLDFAMKIFFKGRLNDAQKTATDEGFPLTRNKNFRPPHLIIKEAIENFGGRVFFTINELSYSKCETALGEAIKTVEAVVPPSISMNDLIVEAVTHKQGKTTEYLSEIKENLTKSNIDTDGMPPEITFAHMNLHERYFEDDSGYSKITYENFIWYNILNYYPNSGVAMRAIEKKLPLNGTLALIKDEIMSRLNRLREKADEKGEPLSGSFLVTEFLRQSDGNLGQAIEDTKIALNILSRYDLESMTFLGSGVCEQFLRLIKDEFLPISDGPFNSGIAKKIGAIDSQKKVLSLLNMIGSAYHVFGVLLARNFASSHFIKSVKLGFDIVNKAAEDSSHQGPLKIAIDSLACLNLNRFDGLIDEVQNFDFGSTNID